MRARGVDVLIARDPGDCTRRIVPAQLLSHSAKSRMFIARSDKSPARREDGMLFIRSRTGGTERLTHEIAVARQIRALCDQDPRGVITQCNPTPGTFARAALAGGAPYRLRVFELCVAHGVALRRVVWDFVQA